MSSRLRRHSFQTQLELGMKYRSPMIFFFSRARSLSGQNQKSVIIETCSLFALWTTHRENTPFSISTNNILLEVSLLGREMKL